MKISANEITAITNKIKEDVVVITFVDFKYIEIFRIFYKFWKTHELNNLIVVCLDEKTKQEIEKLCIPCIYFKYVVSCKPEFWAIRLDIINSIFTSSKKTLIHTDVDCFWIKNIIPLLSCFEQDVIYSTGNEYPKHLAEKYGFVLCCGFFVIKYKENTKNFFNNIIQNHIKNTSKLIDDQIATNEWIFSKVASISLIDQPSKKHPSQNINIRDVSIVGLHRGLITRWTNPPKWAIDECYCYHPYLTGNISDRLFQLEHLTSLYNC